MENNKPSGVYGRIISMRLKVKIKDKIYDIEVSQIKENIIKVEVNDKDYFFTKDKTQETVLIDRKDLSSFFGEEKKEILYTLPRAKEIKTPIAGVISKIYVKEGEEIKAGKTVAKLIAMKMENDIISESDGKVKEIKIRENQFVNSGQIIIILE